MSTTGNILKTPQTSLHNVHSALLCIANHSLVLCTERLTVIVECKKSMRNSSSETVCRLQRSLLYWHFGPKVCRSSLYIYQWVCRSVPQKGIALKDGSGKDGMQLRGRSLGQLRDRTRLRLNLIYAQDRNRRQGILGKTMCMYLVYLQWQNEIPTCDNRFAVKLAFSSIMA